MLCSINEENGGQSFIYYDNTFLSSTSVSQLMSHLEKISFQESEANHHRAQKWYHRFDVTTPFCNEWTNKCPHPRWKTHAYEPWMHALHTKVEQYVQTNIVPGLDNLNAVLINYYPNPSDHFPLHQDKATSSNPDYACIISISLGEERRFEFERCNRKETHLDCAVTLKSGSLLVMGGTCQQYYAHRLCKGTSGSRYNFTFRCTEPRSHN